MHRLHFLTIRSLYFLVFLVYEVWGGGGREEHAAPAGQQ